MENTRSTIYDVAKLSGVSVATVSRFLNNPVMVSENTKAKIAAAIRSLEYIPNTFAQALKTSCSRLIMMTVPDIFNQYYAEMYKVIQSIINAHGYSIMLIDTGESVEQEIRALETAREHSCDAVLIFSVYDTPEMYRRIQSLGLPFIYNNGNRETETGENYERSIYLTASHLIDYGHRDILYVGGSPQTYINTIRRNGFIKAMEEHGLAYGPEDWFEMDFSMEAGFKAGKFISSLGHRPTAVCAANDQLAFGIMIALDECGIRVPQDISITGMDDVAFSRLISPKLTTIKNDCEVRGRYLAELILYQLSVKDVIPQRNLRQQENIIIRDSTRRL